MAFPSLLVFFFVFLLKFCDSKCPKSFSCQNLESLEYPLTQLDHPDCGLIKVLDCDSSAPKFQLGNKEYDVLERISKDKFIVRDTALRYNLNTRGCLSFSSTPIPFSPDISFIISPNLTLFRCDKPFIDSEHVEDYFKNYKNHSNCTGFTLYYRNPEDVNLFWEADHPSECQMIQLPMNATENWSDDLFKPLAYEYTIEWLVSHNEQGTNKKKVVMLAAGKGGYGSVYKGKLQDGRLVAVKILSELKGNGEEFTNEVSSISRTSHVNVVTLLGFCFDGSKRALVYEFMPNGSLEKFMPNTSSSAPNSLLGVDKLFEIVVGIAQGLEYLHQGCNTRILHFDIKPHNILLDKDFRPKISDFGLSKLCPNRSSIVSMQVARGTVGYIAPEVFCRNFGEVSHKSDVYSYGMMVLEMLVGRQNNINPQGERSSEIYFSDWIYKNLDQNTIEKGVLDNNFLPEDEWNFVKRRLIIIGLWCIQTDPKNRPSISRVIEMLEAKLESLKLPPRPYLSSSPILPLISSSLDSEPLL